MKVVAFELVAVSLALSAVAENQTVQSPITMEQLMWELRIKGGNWVFNFDRPVLAKVICTISAFPDGKTSEVTEFLSDTPQREFSLFFMVSPDRVGEWPKPNRVNERHMKVKLSNCAATDGTRILRYIDKFTQNPWVQQQGEQGDYRPYLPLHPELNKEYVLHYYYREGDPYEAKVTICFVEKAEDGSKVEKYVRGTGRTWQSADQGERKREGPIR